MKTVSKGYIPKDMAALLFPTLFGAVAAIGAGTLIVLANAPRWHSDYLTVGFAIASLAAMVGAVFLFLAKLAQYRRGVFFQFGCASESEAHRQNYYRWAYSLIVPACLALVLLLRIALLHLLIVR